MSLKPKVSVCCVTYNHAEFIRDALDGFVSQETDFPFEVIVHDDASTDGTADVVAEYAREYPAIIKPILQSDNQYSQHIPIFKTFVLPMVQGEYIARCEGDDFWCDSTKLQRQIDVLDSNPDCPAAAHNTKMVRYGTRQTSTMGKMGNDGMIPLETLISQAAGFHTSSLVYRTSLEGNRPPCLAHGRAGVGDYPLRVYLALSGGVYYIDRVMSVYRLGTPGSWSDRMRGDKQKGRAVNDGLIAMLEEANEWSGFQHDAAFRFAIREQEYTKLNRERQWRAMLSPEYEAVYAAQSLRHRARILVSAACPKLGEVLAK